MKISIRWIVILGSVLLVWGTQLIIMPVSIFSSKKVMLDHTRDIMANILDLTLVETQNYFSVARGAAHLTERLLASDVVATDHNAVEKLERYFCDQLDLYPQFAGIYFADPSGAFYYVNREPDPAKGVYRFKQISFDQKGVRTTRMFWRNQDRQILAEKIDFQDTYDPASRPWYKKAVQEQGIIWTDPYVFFSSQKPGITTAGPLYNDNGELQGVVGVDIELDVLSMFVGKLRVGKTGIAFIVNENTDVIAFPDVSRLKYQEGEKGEGLRLPRLEELENPLCKKAYDAVRPALKPGADPADTLPAFAAFDHQDHTYYTMFTRVQTANIHWMVGVYIPEKDYLGAIKENQRMTLLLTLAISILATLAGLVMVKKISDPILALDAEAQKIKQDDYSGPGRITSMFGEIQRTADSFFEMKSAVKAYKEALKQKETVHRDIWKELQQARKVEAMGTLAGGIAHDFNNILSGILGHAEVLQTQLTRKGDGQKEGLDPELAMQNLDGIVTAGERARDLVRQILTFSFQENQKLAPLALAGILNEACSLLASSLPKNIIIHTKIDANCPMVMGNATQIHQVALNLMTNAFQSMEGAGGTLGVTLSTVVLDEGERLRQLGLGPGSYLCYAVSDTGSGISPRIMDKIFDPYFTTKPEGTGTGLGLAVIRGIVQAHGGGIHVESSPGKGSRFEVFLPAHSEDLGTLKPGPGPARIQKGNEHVLLVDDQKSVITVEQQILEILGYRVTSCLSGKEALDTFVQTPGEFDLVVTDMSMPGMTGDVLALEVKVVRPDMPVILVTGYSETMARDKAMEMGLEDFLMKPVRLKTFSAAIRRALDGS